MVSPRTLKGAAGEIVVVAPVLQRHQPGDGAVAVQPLAPGDGDGGAGIGLDRADAVDARHRGDDDHIVPLQDRPRRRMAHAVDLLIDGAVLLDIGVGAGDIGFRLVIVVIADEILDRVLRKELLELGIELGRQGLVGGQDQGRALGAGDHLGHGEGLARAGDAKQHLVALLGVDALHQLGDGGGLVAGRLVFAHQLEFPAAFGFLRPGRAVGDEGAALGHRRQRRGQGGGIQMRRLGQGRPGRLGEFRGIGAAAPRLSAVSGNHAVIVGHGPNIAARSGSLQFRPPPNAAIHGFPAG